MSGSNSGGDTDDVATADFFCSAELQMESQAYHDYQFPYLPR
jgi:hypothetical protein